MRNARAIVMAFGATALWSLVVACAAPPPVTLGAGASDLDDDTPTSTAKSTKKKTPSTPSGGYEDDDDDDDSASSSNVVATGTRGQTTMADFRQCVTGCLGNDKTAVALNASYSDCWTNCGATLDSPGDPACGASCESMWTQSCQSLPTTCAKINDCAQGCVGTATSTPSAAIATYSQIAPLIAANCRGCHQGEFSTLAKVKANRPAMLTELSNGYMPEDDPTWSETPDGQALIAFLTSSPELR